FPLHDEFNGAEQEGCGFLQLTQTPFGHRATSAYAFLDDVLDGPDLTLLTVVQVTKVLFYCKQAMRVEMSRAGKQGKREQLHANKEVILSAGVINTPQLLKLSGIGPAAELAQHNIAQVHDLTGVGENLPDHPDVIVRYLSKAGGSLTAALSLEPLKFFRK